MKRNLILLILLLIAQLCIAQSGYPKQILLKNDTVIVFTPHQLQLINYTKVSLDECKEFNKSYIKEISSLRDVVIANDSYVSTLNKSLVKSTQISNELLVQVELLEQSNRKLRNKVKLARVSKYTFTIIGIVGGFYLGTKFSN